MITYLSFQERRYRRLFGLILVFYLIFLGIFFLPELSGYQKRKNLQKKYLEQQNQKELWENYLKLKEEKAIKANKLRGLESKLNLISESHLLIDSFQEIILSSGVKIKDCSLGLIIDEQLYPWQKVSLIFTGQYSEIMTFLTLIIKKSLYRDIRLVISPVLRELECVLELEVFLRPQLPEGQDEL